ncbi:MAG: hypothetical protein Q4A56_07740 [Porphyromonadaceae bacterium]|nr:hypothetical protein [Porphyromonadaceae bacterium]
MKRIIFILLFTWFVLLGCRTRYITLTNEHVKTEYKTLYQRDSIYLVDSVYIYNKGDTVFVEKIKKTNKYHTLRDTVFINDTIRVEDKPVITDTNRRKANNTLVVWSVISTVILILAAIYKIKRFFK